MPKRIGIIGGMGPYAGLDLNQKIFNNTIYQKDQDHLEVILLSASNRIQDRSEYLLAPNKIENPAIAASQLAEELYLIGVRLAAIPCNTFHSKPIFELFQKRINEKKLVDFEVVHLIENTFASLKETNPTIQKLGLLATEGTYLSRIYETTAKDFDLELIIPNLKEQKEIHQAIYDREYGIKAKSAPTSERASKVITTYAEKLIHQGGEGIIMGCTEIPLVLNNHPLEGIKIDPAELLARTLVKKIDPLKLTKI